ncbi:MAG: hypothetical protein NZ870_04160 [bacterium]|nr:hypothetical protein [bacterium]
MTSYERAPSWFINDDPYVISTRVRVARSIEGYKFPWKLKPQEAERIIDEVMSIKIDKATKFTSQDMDLTLKKLLIERHLISPDFTKYTNTACIITADESISVMINEEDHIRIQAFASGEKTIEALKKVNEVQSIYEKKLKFLIHKRWGYITTCPTNLGAAIRVSFLMHLPGIFETTGSKFFEGIGKLGVAIRGFYGEGSMPLAHLLQISNASSFGRSVDDIIQNIKKIAEKIIETEKDARKKLLSKIEFVEEIYRSYGILKEARILSLEEAFKFLSLLRLAASEKIIKIDMSEINNILIIIQDAHIDYIASTELAHLERKKMRANIVRDKLRK